MQIKHKFELSIETNWRYIIRSSASGRQIACSQCGEPMLTVEHAAGFFNIGQRRIFQIIETEVTHFQELEAGSVMICIQSLGQILENGNASTSQCSELVSIVKEASQWAQEAKHERWEGQDRET